MTGSDVSMVGAQQYAVKSLLLCCANHLESDIRDWKLCQHGWCSVLAVKRGSRAHFFAVLIIWKATSMTGSDVSTVGAQ